MAAVSARGLLPSNEPQELLPCPGIAAEGAANKARDGGGVLLLDAAHHHAEVIRFDDDAYSLGFQYVLQRVADLLAEAFLGLEPASEHVHDPCDFAQADGLLRGDVTDVYLPDEREQVVFAERVALDVLHDDHPVRVSRKERAVHDFLEILAVARCEELHRFLPAFGSFTKPRTLGVFAEELQDGCEGVSHAMASVRHFRGMKQLFRMVIKVRCPCVHNADPSFAPSAYSKTFRGWGAVFRDRATR